MPPLYQKINFQDGLDYKERHASHAMIYNPNIKKFLVFEEISNPFVTAKYTLIGGAIEEGETKEQALLREFEEEAGIDPKNISNMRYLGQNILGWVFQSLKKPGYKFNMKLTDEVFYFEMESEKEGFEADGCITRLVSKGELTKNCGGGTKFLLENYT